MFGSGLLPFLLLACGEKETAEDGLNLSILFVSHETNDDVYLGYPELFEVQIVENLKASLGGMEVAWFVGEQAACDWSAVAIPDSSSTFSVSSTCDIIFAEIGEGIILKTRQDGVEIKEELLELNVSQAGAPTVKINSPEDESVFLPEEELVLEAQVELNSGLEEYYGLIEYSWSSDSGGVSGSGNFSADGVITFSPSELSGGSHEISLTAFAPEEDGQAGTDAITIIINSAPEITELGLSNENPEAADILLCSATVSDPEDGELTPLFSWEIDGQPVETGDSLSLSPMLAEVGSMVTCLVSAQDSRGLEISDSVSAVVINTPPEFTEEALINPSIEVYADTSLICSAATDDLNDGILMPSYSWDVGGMEIGTEATLQLDPSLVSPLDILNCTATVVDNDGALIDSSASITIENSTPVIDTPVITPNSGIIVGSVLSCSATALDINDGDLSSSVTYQWQSSGTTLAIGSTYTVDASLTASGDTIDCIAMITDSQGDSETAQASVIVENSLPVFTSNSAISPSSGIYTGTQLGCSAMAMDADDGALIPDYEWSVSGISIGSGSTYTIDADDTNVGDLIDCTAMITDLDGEISTSIDSVTIENTAPIFVSASLSNGAPKANEEVSCTGIGSDPDGEISSISYTYSWEIDGNPVGSGTTMTLDPSTALVGSTLTCVVTVEDSHGDFDIGITEGTIANTAPTVSLIAISPDSEVYTGTELSCSATGDDINDGSLTTSVYEWSVSGVSVGSGATYIVDANDTDVGDSVSCTATVADNNGEETSGITSIIVENSAPIVSNVQISSDSGSYYNDEILTCSATIIDVDEMPIVSYEWSSSTGILGDTLSLDLSTINLMPSDSLICVVTAMDGSSVSSSDSLEVFIGDRAPTPPSVSLDWSGSAAAPHDVNDVDCQGSGSIDPDGESVSYSYSWASDFGQIFSGESISGRNTIPTETWSCTVSATAGALSSESTASTTIYSRNWQDCPSNQTFSDATLLFLGENIGDGVGDIYATGDVDGDGLEDILIGAALNDDGGNNAGKVYLFLGSSVTSNLDVSSTIGLGNADYIFTGDNAGDEAGSGVEIIPDVDGDGLDDILIGAAKSSAGGTNAGKIYLIFSSSLGSNSSIDLSQADYQFIGEANSRLGDHLSSADIDGDGREDLLFGAPYYDSFSGRSYVILADSLSSSNVLLMANNYDYRIQGSGFSDYWIGAISGGDFDNDGLGDILIGAPQITGSGAGYAYLFFGANLGGSVSLSVASADIIFNGETAGDYAGHDVRNAGDIDGDGSDDILISAILNSDGASDAGKVYLILGSSLNGVSTFELVDADYSFVGENSNDESGRSISGAGDIDGDGISDILIGAPYQDDGGSNAGKAYLFSGASILENPLYTAFDLFEADYSFTGSGSDEYVGEVDLVSGDINGDTVQDVLVGAAGNDELALYLGCEFINDAPTRPDVMISWSSGGIYAQESDDLICTAAGSVDPEGDPEGGSISYAYSWESSAGATVSGAAVLGSETNADERWTCTVVASDGIESRTVQQDVWIYTAFWEDCPTTQSMSEAAYIFLGESGGDQAGYETSSAGDIDGDGLDDILVSAIQNEETGGASSGKVYLILGSSLQTSSTIDLGNADYSFLAENIGDHLGSSVASAGDVDGDGLDDILIGAAQNNTGGSEAGKVYLILGATLMGHNGSTFNLGNADHSFLGSAAGNHTGNYVAGIGDVDGDGLDDIMIGASQADNQSGRSYLFFGASLGGSTNFDFNADHIFYGEDSADQSGFSFAGGDINGDGLSDIVISAPYNDDGGTDAGKIYLILGSSLQEGVVPVNLSDADYMFLGENAGDYAGYSVSVAGNLDGDSNADIIIGAEHSHDGGTDSGKAYVLLGASLGSFIVVDLSQADYSFIGEEDFDNAGHKVSAVEDADGDGLDDILIAANYADLSGANSGKGYLILASSLGVNSTIDLGNADYMFTGDNADDEAGVSLSGTGDFNGDGRADILIGVHYADSNGIDAGQVGLFTACD